jgi:hypothetical protein
MINVKSNNFDHNNRKEKITFDYFEAGCSKSRFEVDNFNLHNNQVFTLEHHQ